jgi:hypothetical protein
MEDVAGMQYEVDVPGEDVGDRGFEAVFDVDRALVPPRLRVDFSIGGAPKMGIRQVGNAKRASRKVGKSVSR